MSMVRAMKASEHTFCYSEGEERDTRYGCIGHLRADFGRSGKEFWTSFFDHVKRLKTDAFRDDLQETVDGLREDVLKDLSAARRFCDGHPDAMISDDWYGFRMDTPGFVYMLRIGTVQGDYNVYLYCYDRTAFECAELAAKDKRAEELLGSVVAFFMNDCIETEDALNELREIGFTDEEIETYQ